MVEAPDKVGLVVEADWYDDAVPSAVTWAGRAGYGRVQGVGSVVACVGSGIEEALGESAFVGYLVSEVGFARAKE
jgi:hypothetical protein